MLKRSPASSDPLSSTASLRRVLAGSDISCPSPLWLAARDFGVELGELVGVEHPHAIEFFVTERIPIDVLSCDQAFAAKRVQSVLEETLREGQEDSLHRVPLSAVEP